MSSAASSRTMTVMVPSLAAGTEVGPKLKTLPRRDPPAPCGQPKPPDATPAKACPRRRALARPKAAPSLGAAPRRTFCQSGLIQAYDESTMRRRSEQALRDLAANRMEGAWQG